MATKTKKLNAEETQMIGEAVAAMVRNIEEARRIALDPATLNPTGMFPQPVNLEEIAFYDDGLAKWRPLDEELNGKGRKALMEIDDSDAEAECRDTEDENEYTDALIGMEN